MDDFSYQLKNIGSLNTEWRMSYLKQTRKKQINKYYLLATKMFHSISNQ